MQDKAKILHLIESLNMGGAQKIIYQLASTSDSSDHSVCSLYQGGPYEKIMRDDDIDLTLLKAKRRSVIFFPLFIYDLYCIFTRLVRIVKKDQIDILHAHLPDSSLIAIVVGKLTNTTVVLTVHNNFALPSKRKAPLRDALRTLVTNMVFKRANYIITVGNDIRDSLYDALGYRVAIKTVYNGVDYLRYARDLKKLDHLQFRQSLGISDKATIVTTVGRLDKQKGHTYLIDAAQQLIDDYPALIFLLVGEGELKEKLMDQVQSLQLSNNFIFLGNRNDVPDILAMSDLFVLPSIYEGIPLVILEAMAAGLPVVATDIAGTRELVESGVDGLLAKTESPKDIARTMNELLSDMACSKEMSLLAQAKVKKEFSLQKMVTGTEHIYLEVLGSV
ncbi:hypothetical protein MNBD_GAMMA26-6 [hydrothermal vent metagenome]|uniref:Glycosyltransferase n=1 Tax=hydrothermal vent metagenome TaxID=652676 RepID=A0A3B1BYY5_9ZZZZ